MNPSRKIVTQITLLGFKLLEEERKVKKHKLSPSPNKDYFLKVPSKRPNTACSPDKTI